MVCLLIFVATVVAATSTLVTFLLFLHLLFLPVEQRAARPLRPCGNIFNLPNGTVSQVKAIPIHDTSARSGSGFCVCGSGMWAKKHKKKRNHSRNFNNSNASFASHARCSSGSKSIFRLANRMIYEDNRETHFRRMQTGTPHASSPH